MGEIRRAIVIGGAGGIGSSICGRLAADGYRVVVADIDRRRAEAVLGTLEGEGHEAAIFDITKDNAVDAAFDAIEANGPAAVLIVASGGLLVDFMAVPNIAAMSTEDWNRTLAYNLTGVFFCVRKFAALRLAKPLANGRIVILSSAVGQIGASPTDIGYITSKAAIFGLMRKVAYDLKDASVTVNAVAPGPVATAEFLRTTNEQIRAGAASVTLLNRLATPDEVSAGVAFLAGAGASYITGTVFDINGGSHLN